MISPFRSIPAVFTLLIALTSPAYCEPMFAVTTTNQLVRFDTESPSKLLSTKIITGLQSGENILGIDFRPANSKMYALGSTGRLYTINLGSGAVSQIGSSFTTPLSGSDFGFSFNPVVDRIRIVSDTEQNIRINPDTSEVVATDTNLAYDAGDANASLDPRLTCIAYTNNFSGATTSTLFGLDTNSDTFLTLGGVAGSPSPNIGTLFSRAKLGVTSTPRCGLDISNLTGRMYGSFTPAGDTSSKLFKISFGLSHSMTQKGTIGSGIVVRGISSPIFEANAPTITVTAPLRSVTRTTRSSIRISGSATDDTLLSSVKYRTVVSGQESELKTLNTEGDFVFTVSLPAGRTTTVEIVATDIWGNESSSTLLSINRRAVVRRPVRR